MNPSNPFEQAQQFTGLWMDFATRMAGAGLAYRPDSTPPEAARAVRSTAFDAMAAASEKFLRSDEFLAMMKQSLDSSIELRQQFNDFLTQVHHQSQGVARQDVDSILQSVRHVETRTLERLEQVVEQLQDATRRLDALEQHARNGKSSGGENGHGRGKSEPPAEVKHV